jgi:hypothetical protein
MKQNQTPTPRLLELTGMESAMSKNLSSSFKFSWQFLRSQTVTLLLEKNKNLGPQNSIPGT